MKRAILTLIFCSVASLAFSQDYWCLNRHVSVFGEYGYFRRSEIRNLPLVQNEATLIEDNGNLRGRRVLKTDALVDALKWNSAFSLGTRFHLDACRSLEAQYTYFCPWEGKVAVEGGALKFPFKEKMLDSDYVNAQRVEGLYRSKLQDIQANYWGHITPQRVDYFSFSWVGGFRYVRLKEKMELTFFKGADASDYKTSTTNALYGVQLGAMLEVNPSCHFSWTARIKGGAFFNDADNDLTIFDDNNTRLLHHYSKPRLTGSFLLEGYGQITYHLNGYISLYGSYEGFVITGLALAPEQRDTKLRQNGRIKVNGQIVVDGARIGLNIGF